MLTVEEVKGLIPINFEDKIDKQLSEKGWCSIKVPLNISEEVLDKIVGGYKGGGWDVEVDPKERWNFLDCKHDKLYVRLKEGLI